MVLLRSLGGALFLMVGMTPRILNLKVPGELWARLQRVLGDRPDALQRFVIRAIANELKRQKQPVSRKQVFWAEVASLRAEMEAEGSWVDVDEVWGDVRERAIGREVIL